MNGRQSGKNPQHSSTTLRYCCLLCLSFQDPPKLQEFVLPQGLVATAEPPMLAVPHSMTQHSVPGNILPGWDNIAGEGKCLRGPFAFCMRYLHLGKLYQERAMMNSFHYTATWLKGNTLDYQRNGESELQRGTGGNIWAHKWGTRSEILITGAVVYFCSAFRTAQCCFLLCK